MYNCGWYKIDPTNPKLPCWYSLTIIINHKNTDNSRLRLNVIGIIALLGNMWLNLVHGVYYRKLNWKGDIAIIRFLNIFYNIAAGEATMLDSKVKIRK